MPLQLFVIFLGAGAGGVLRYLATIAMRPRDTASGFPFGTLAVNLVGCLLVGYLATLIADRFPGREALRLGLIVGVLGGFTTFSSFSRETFTLINEGKWPSAIAYVLASNAIGIALTFTGHAIARRLHAST